MQYYSVTGMSCAACSNAVERAVKKVPGVESCFVNLLTNEMGVDGKFDPEQMISAVAKAGYRASPKREQGEVNDTNDRRKDEEMLIDQNMRELHFRLLWSSVFLIILMYFSMGHMMWSWPVPSAIADNHVAMGLIQMLLAIAVMVINQNFFIHGFRSLFHGKPNMDSLVALGAGASFLYSTYALFAMTDAQLYQNSEKVVQYMNEFYFESASMILTLITVGKLLEAKSKGKTTNALKGLIDLAPQKAIVLVDGVETEIPASTVKKGDQFLVRPGDSIPVDGIILDGNSSINEASLTGESIPVDKKAGDEVFAATINQYGFLRCEANRVGEDTTLSQIIKMVSNASITKAPIAKIADKVSGVFVPIVIIIAFITGLSWIFAGYRVGYALARAVSVLVISCPCALGLATPVAIMVGNGVAAKNGMMFKTSLSLEQTGRAKTVILDKTGTITSGTPKVTDIIPAGLYTESDLVQLAYSLEKKSEHPLAGAITEYGLKQGLTANEVKEFTAVVGNGLTAIYEKETIAGGKESYISQFASIPDTIYQKSVQLAEEGKTVLFFSQDTKLVGLIAVADVMKEDSKKAIAELKKMGIHTVMLTGDNKRTAKAIGQLAGVDEVIAEMLPDGKETVVAEWMKKGKTIMVGDGINDAPALTRADVGIAIGAGTDIALDAADVVLMKSRLCDVPAAIRCSRATIRNIHENLFWAFIYNIIGIPLAAGVWIPITGWALNPMFGAAAMSLSSFCVVTNALRLNYIKLYQSNKKEENREMTKTIRIEGMMCAHCEARVKQCLEEIEGVIEVNVSHVKGTATIVTNLDIHDKILSEKIEAQGYKVIEIKSTR